MGSEMIDSLYATCSLTLDTLDAILQNIKINNIHRSKRILIKFLKMILKQKPLLKIEGKNQKETKALHKYVIKIHREVVKDLLVWVKDDDNKNIRKHINAKIKDLKNIINNINHRMGCSEVKSINKSKKIKKNKKKDEESEEEGSDSDTSQNNYNSASDSDYECDSESEDSFNEDDEDSSFHLDSSDEEDSDEDSEEEYEDRSPKRTAQAKLVRDDDSDADDDEDDDDNNEEGDDENTEDDYCKKLKKNGNMKCNNKKNKNSKILKIKEKKNLERLEKYIKMMKYKSHEGTSAHLNSFKKCSKLQKKKILKGFEKYEINGDGGNKPLMYRVLLSDIPDNGKKDILTRIQQNRQEDSSKFREWLEGVLSIPFGHCVDTPVNASSSKTTIKNFLGETRDCLDDAVHGHNDAKQKIMQFIAQTISNKSPHGLVMGIEGPMGNGKTTLVEKGFAKALKRPFITIPLGGIQDGSFLEGHGYTYEGSRWGSIVNSLIVSRCMNPVIYMDELDKVSQTHHGTEIINLLIHLVDPSQNSHFRDKYFAGIDFDLSKATFIFSYNDADQINPVLMDRITHLKTRGFRLPEKVIISQKYLLTSIFDDVGINTSDIEIPDDVLEWIVQSYTHEGGVRHLKKILYDIVREINLRNLTSKSIKFPLKITKKDLEMDYLKKRRIYQHEKIHKRSTVGKINGLYATCNDTGGITVIEASWVPSDTRLRLELTGRQGDIMKESMQVAKTLAWKLLSNDLKEKWEKRWVKDGFQGIHIHCPEGATPKDGPSAGAAITTALYSLLSEKAIKNTIGITGEIDLSGKVLEIGGLESKIFGAINAGCKKVLCPVGNKKDLDKIMEERGEEFKNYKIEIKTISTIKDVFKEMLK